MTPSLVVFDLDDTLFPERAYVASGLAAVGDLVCRRWGRTEFAAVAWELFEGGLRGRIFDAALALLGLPTDRQTIESLVSVYRDHQPTIALFPEAERTVQMLRERCRIAIISDGPLFAQQRKIDALGLHELFAPIVLTDTWGREFWKPHGRAFRLIEEETGHAGAECLYVGDNPAKDFQAPRQLGWATVRLRRPGGEHAATEALGAADAECADLWDLLHLIEGRTFGGTPRSTVVTGRR